MALESLTLLALTDGWALAAQLRVMGQQALPVCDWPACNTRGPLDGRSMCKGMS